MLRKKRGRIIDKMMRLLFLDYVFPVYFQFWILQIYSEDLLMKKGKKEPF